MFLNVLRIVFVFGCWVWVSRGRIRILILLHPDSTSGHRTCSESFRCLPGCWVWVSRGRIRILILFRAYTLARRCTGSTGACHFGKGRCVWGLSGNLGAPLARLHLSVLFLISCSQWRVSLVSNVHGEVGVVVRRRAPWSHEQRRNPGDFLGGG